jgi:hypothetical protein
MKEKVKHLIELMGKECGEGYEELYTVLGGCSVAELEDMAMFLKRAWLREHTPEHELLRLVLEHRKWKLNAEFVYSPENVAKILHLDKQLMACQERLCQEAESEIVRLKQKKESDTAFLHEYGVECKVTPYFYVKDDEVEGQMWEVDEGIDGLLNLMQSDYRLRFRGETSEELRRSQYFQEKLNWNESDMPGRVEQTDFYISYGMHELCGHSFFSLSDVLRINRLWGEVTTLQQHFVDNF